MVGANPQQHRQRVKQWTQEELEREAEQQLSLRLRGSRRTLKQRKAAADAAHLDTAPLFTTVMQWPGTMDQLERVFQQRADTAVKRRGGLDDVDNGSEADASRSPSMDSLVGEGSDGDPFAAGSASPARSPVLPPRYGVQLPPASRATNASSRLASLIPPGTVDEELFVGTLWSLTIAHILASRGTDSPAVEALEVETNASTENSPARGGGRSRRGGPTFAAPPRLSIALQNIMTPSFERQHRTQFRRVFRLCDPKCTGGITWDTLTSFLLDSTMFMKVQRETALALPVWYQIKERVNTMSHRPRVLKRMGNTNSLFIVDGSGQLYQFCSDTHVSKPVVFKKPGMPDPQLLLMIDAEFIPTENGLCISTVGADLHFFDFANKNLEKVLLVDSAQLLVWHPFGKRLVTGDREGRITLWSFHRINAIKRTKAPLLVQSFFVEKGVAIQAIACGNERDVIVVGCANGHVQVHSSQSTGTPMRSFHTGSATLNCIAISEHQNVIACGTVEFHPELWSIDNGGGNTPFFLDARIAPHASPIVSVACLRGSPQCVSLDYAGVTKVWHMHLLTCLQTFVLHKHDPRSPWRGLLEVNGYLFCTDRIEINAFHVVEDGTPIVESGKTGGAGTGGGARAIEFAVAQRGASLAVHYFENLGPSIVSLSGPCISYWDPKTQRITAQLDPTLQNATITAMAADATGNRCFLGDERGSVWVLNIATAGVLECFPRAHNGKAVSGIGYLTHIGVGLSCSMDGVGMLLAPPSRQANVNLLHQRVQPMFSGMDVGLLVVVDEWQIVVVADRTHRVHVYSTADVGTIAKLTLLVSCFVPDVLANPVSRASSFRTKSAASLLITDDTEFLPRGRCIVDVRHVPHQETLFLLVADNSSLCIMGLVGARHAPPRPPFPMSTDTSAFRLVVLAQWNIFTSFDGSISSVLYSALCASDRDDALERVHTAAAADELDAEAEEERALQEQLVMQENSDAAHGLDEASVTSTDKRSASGTGLGETSPSPVRGESPLQHDSGTAPSSPVAEDDSMTDFEREMAQLYASQRAKEVKILDPQIVLLNGVGTGQQKPPHASFGCRSGPSTSMRLESVIGDVQLEDSVVVGGGEHDVDCGDRNDPVLAHYFVVAMESGSVLLLDATEAFEVVYRVLREEANNDGTAAAAPEPFLYPMRMIRLNTPVTSVCSMTRSSICCGRADGLLDVLEVPSLGLMWSGLAAVADAPDYFPPTVDVRMYEGVVAKLKSTVPCKVSRLSKLRSVCGSVMLMASARHTAGLMSPKKGSDADVVSFSPKRKGTARFSQRQSPRGGESILDHPSTQAPVLAKDDVLPVDDSDLYEVGTPNASSAAIARKTISPLGRPPKTRHHNVTTPTASSLQPPSGSGPPVDDSAWILGQLCTLCGDRSFLEHLNKGASIDDQRTGKLAEKFLRVTASGVAVFQGKDPFAECTAAGDPGGPVVSHNIVVAQESTDCRRSKKQKNEERFSIQNPIPMKPFNALGVSRPSSSRSLLLDQSDTALRFVPEPLMRASLLRPLSSTGQTAHRAVSSIPSRQSSAASTALPQRPASVQGHFDDARDAATRRVVDTAHRQSGGAASKWKSAMSGNVRRNEVELPPWLMHK